MPSPSWPWTPPLLGGEGGRDYPLRQLWRRTLSQTQQIWACPLGQAPRIGRGWKHVQLPASGPGAWQEMGWEQGSDSQRPEESRKLQGYTRGRGRF